MGVNSRITQLQNGTGPFKAKFTVGGAQREAGLLVKGLGVGESIAIEGLASQAHDENDAVEADWVPLMTDGVAVTLTADNNFLSVLTPGVYRLNCGAAAGTVFVGIYY